MAGTCVAAIDAGTTVIKAALFDLAGRRQAVAARECPVIKRKDGRIENDPRALARQAFACLKETLESSRVKPAKVAAVSVSSQRATVICAGGNGRAIGNAVSWQDMRGSREVEALRKRIPDRRYYKITGIPNHPVFTLGKLLWIKRNDPARYRKTARFVLVHDYLLKELGCRDFFCDWSNASLTGMLDVSKFRWSRDVLGLAGVQEGKLGTLVPSGKRVGTISRRAATRSGLLEGTPIVSGGGDQQCAGLGAGAVAPGILEITLGTAAVPLCYSHSERRDTKMRVSCCAHAIAGEWEVEGLQNAAGASLEWLKKILGLEGHLPRELLMAVDRLQPGAGGVLFYPYLAGSAAPHWDPQAGAMFLGLRHPDDRVSLIRAVMEGVSLETREIIEVFAALGLPLREVRLTGGYTAIEVWNQIQADIYGKAVSTLHEPQATLLGAAILAGCGVGVFASVREAARKMVRIKKTYAPRAEQAARYRDIFKKYCEVHRDLRERNVFRKAAKGG